MCCVDPKLVTLTAPICNKRQKLCLCCNLSFQQIYRIYSDALLTQALLSHIDIKVLVIAWQLQHNYK